MAKVFTQEEREKIKGQIVDLVRQSGRETLRQLEAKTGATRYQISVLARELVANGDVYNSGYGLFPSEQARKDWRPQKTIEGKGEETGCGRSKPNLVIARRRNTSL
ncbi:phage exclusion protein [Escherichia coli]|nr:phage exclusion protein [Escherichia coli]